MAAFGGGAENVTRLDDAVEGIDETGGACILKLGCMILHTTMARNVVLIRPKAAHFVDTFKDTTL